MEDKRALTRHCYSCAFGNIWDCCENNQFVTCKKDDSKKEPMDTCDKHTYYFEMEG